MNAAASTVTSADIARLAGVGRAAVSNWRRRFDDFPRPVAGTSASPRYRMVEIEDWLRAHDRTAEITPLDRLWQLLRTEFDDHELGSLMGHAAGLLALLARKPRAWAGLSDRPDHELWRGYAAALAAEVPEFPSVDPDLGGGPAAALALRRIGAVVQGGITAAHALGFLIGRFLEANSRRTQPTQPALAQLAVALAGVHNRSVFDPACGTGALLVAARAAGAVTLAAQDLDRVGAALTAARLVTEGAPVEVAVRDSLRADGFSGRLFGAVVCDPPFADRNWGYEQLGADLRWEYGLPPRGEPELAWLQHCLAHAEPGAGVVVLMPPAAAGRRAGQRVRRNLVRSGALRAMVGIPDTGGRTADLWVLHRPRSHEPPPAEVLFVVAEPAAAAGSWRAFRSGAAPPAGPHHRCVAVIDLLDEDVDLSPTRHVAPPAPVAEIDVSGLEAQLVDRIQRLREIPRVSPLPRAHPMTTMEDLIKAAALQVLRAPPGPPLDDGDLPLLTVDDVMTGRNPTGRTSGAAGQVVLQPGDVVVPALAGRESVAMVVEDAAAGAVLGSRLLCLRTDPAKVDPYLLAGILRVAGDRRPRPGTGMTRVQIRRIAVPLLPIEEQRQLGLGFAQLYQFDQAMQRCVEASQAYLRVAAIALAAGRAGTER